MRFVLELTQMKKFFLVLFLNLTVIFFLLPPVSFASLDNFSTDYDVTYAVADDAITHVTFGIKLTNKTSQYYASSYNILVGFRDIQNISARDEDGAITPVINKSSDSTSIEITFNKKVVGLENSLNFSLSLDTKDIVVKSGKIWDINIPGLALQNDFQSFNVHVKVPPYLGRPTYIKPDVKRFADSDLNFTKDELGKSGISLSFGNEQFYKFNLSYHLKNQNLFPISTEIALPPTTNYQDTEIEDITPKPLNVTLDSDGNWLAKYHLLPSQKINVKAWGKVRLALFPKKETLSEIQFKEYLKEQPYWQISNERIKRLAATLQTPNAIYEYVIRNLSYDFSRVTDSKSRAGALGVLSNPNSAVCLEFTDLFVALARAAGIPAREIDGFAFTQNQKERPLSLVKDVLHAWPEYYDQSQERWIMIDPTWGNTTGGVDYFHTLDFDHFAFVIKGKNSSYPIAAGGYKYTEDLETKDVDVEIANSFPEPNQSLTLNETFSSSYFSGAPIKGTITIKNTGNSLSDSKNILIKSHFINPNQQKINIESIPPYGFLTIPVSFDRPSFLTNKTDTITMIVDETAISKQIKISPLFFLSLFTKGTWYLPFFGR